jgi:two-component system osmolarity sensor histidine kinase EnvZ
MLLSVAAWFAIFSAYEREPRARQLAQTLVSVANLTRAALVSARPDARRELLRELSDREGIHIYPAEAGDRVEPLPDRAFLHRVEELVREQLGPHTRLTLEREGERALFVSFRIDDSDEGDYWLALPRERIDRVFPLGWLGWGVAALLLSLLGAWLIVFRITRPLKALQQAAREKSAPARRRPGSTKAARPNWQPWPRLQPDERRPGADRPGPRADPGRHLARPAHAADAPAHGHRNGRRRRPARRHDGRRRGNGQDHRPVPRLRPLGRRRGAAGVDVAALLAEIASQYRRRGFAVELDGIAVAPAPTLHASLSWRCGRRPCAAPSAT